MVRLRDSGYSQLGCGQPAGAFTASKLTLLVPKVWSSRRSGGRRGQNRQDNWDMWLGDK